MPSVSVRAVHGRMSPASALRRMLKGTGITVRQVGRTSFRLEWKEAPVRIAPSVNAEPITLPASDIIVSASKRDESLLDIPLSLSVIALPDGANARGVVGTSDIANLIEGLFLTNLGPGQNRQFIRGVADSPFNGPSQSTVSLQIDEVRVTFNAPDPNLQLVDVDRVEVLKGPQGPLYGTGALGGVFHIVTRKPDLTRVEGFVSLEGSLMRSDDVAFGSSAMFNLPIKSDRVGLRIVGYRRDDSGWIDTPAGRSTNSAKVSGGRVMLRAVIADAWTVDLAGVGQWFRDHNSQYVFSHHSHYRNTSIAEPQNNNFSVVSATTHGKLGSADLTAAVSFVDHEVDTRLDATAVSDAFGFGGPMLFDGESVYRLLDGELRLSGGHALEFSWLGGISYLRSDSRADDKVSAIGSNIWQSVLVWQQQAQEWAAYGEAGLPLFARLRATVGARLFRSSIENEHQGSSGLAMASRRKTGFTPSVALRWKLQPDLMLFARYASAFRPGGLSPIDASGRGYRSDELSNLELGGRFIRGDSIDISATFYRSIWQDIQSDYLLANGLVATRNAGDAQVEGGDLSFTFKWRTGWSIGGGVQYQFARLTRSADGKAQDEDRRLPVVPDLAARASMRRAFQLGNWTSEAEVRGRYFGKARLSFDPNLDRRMGNYAVVDLSLTARRAGWSVGTTLSNLFDSRADSFAFGNPFSIRTMNQYTPLRPRLLRVSVSRHW